MTVVRGLLFAFGYPIAIAVIARFVPVVRQRRLGWLAIHHIAVACIMLAWALDSNWQAVIVNSTWLVTSTIWYASGGRRQSP